MTKPLEKESKPFRVVETAVARIWLDREGILHYRPYVGARIRLEDAAQDLDTCAKLAKGFARPLLMDLSVPASFDRSARARFAASTNKHTINRVAYVFRTKLHKWLSNASRRWRPNSLPQQAFTGEEAALRWLRPHRLAQSVGTRRIRGKKFLMTLENDQILRVIWHPRSLLTSEDARETRRKAERLMQGATAPVLIYLNEIVSIDKSARRSFSGNSRKGIAVALLIDGDVGRTIGNFYLRVNKPKTPTRLFTSEVRAARWLKAMEKSSRGALLSNSVDAMPEGSEPKRRWGSRARNERDEILEVIASFAAGNFSNRKDPASTSMANKPLVAAINILGEELEQTIKRADRSERELALQRELREAEAQSRQAARLAAVGQLAAGVGHEINNPLTIASANVEILERELSHLMDANPHFQKRLTAARIAMERIRKIADGLRTFVRADSPKVELVSVGQVIDETASLLSIIFEKEGVEFTVQGHRRDTDTGTRCATDTGPAAHGYTSEVGGVGADISEISVWGSAGKLQQVLMNLLTNAKDATEGQDVRRIRCVWKVEGSSVVILVGDNGRGIAPDVLKRIFDPYFTTKESGKGTGIGLGITSQIIKAMQGKIAVESQIGKGTEFRVTFPLGKSRNHAPKKRRRSAIKPTVAKTNTVKPSTKVLVVDDELEILDILKGLVEDLGCQVDAVNSVDAALEHLHAKKYSFVFTDLNMPRRGGMDLLSEIAKHNFQPRPKIFVITGAMTPDFSEKMAGEFANLVEGHVLKPFDLDHIEAIITGTYASAKAS